MAWNAVDIGLLPGGNFSIALATSADGSVIVGVADTGDFDGHAFWWTQASGMVDLGLLSGGAISQAQGVSANGSVVVGYADGGSAPSGNTVAVKWTVTAGGSIVVISELGFITGGESSSANGVSADGLVIVGDSTIVPGPGFANPSYPWRYVGAGLVNLGLLAGNTSGIALATSSDGSVVVGGTNNDGAPWSWDSGGGVVAVPLVSGEVAGDANAISADGVTVVGETHTISTSLVHPFLATLPSTATLIGFLGFDDSGFSYGVSADGLISVGASGSFPTANHAFYWTDADGFEQLQPLGGDSAAQAKAISGDGLVPVGFSGPGGSQHAVYWVPGGAAVVAFDGLVRKTLLSIGNFACGPIPTFPVLPQGYPIKVSINMDTTIGTVKSLREVRVAQRLYPLWDLELPFEELREQTQNQELYPPFVDYGQYHELVEFWLMMYGQTNVFAFDAPWDNSRSNQFIGTGDGDTSSFVIYRSWGTGSTAVVAPIGMINEVFEVRIDGNVVSSSDYVVERNKIFFNSPPGNGLPITMTFSYYYLCRFVEDEQDFEEFAKNRWTVNSLKFQTVNWI